MDHPTTQPVPAGALADSVRATLGDLAKVSDELDDGGTARPSLAAKLDTLAGELHRAAGQIRAVPYRAEARP